MRIEITEDAWEAARTRSANNPLGEEQILEEAKAGRLVIAREGGLLQIPEWRDDRWVYIDVVEQAPLATLGQLGHWSILTTITYLDQIDPVEVVKALKARKC